MIQMQLWNRRGGQAPLESEALEGEALESQELEALVMTDAQ